MSILKKLMKLGSEVLGGEDTHPLPEGAVPTKIIALRTFSELRSDNAIIVKVTTPNGQDFHVMPCNVANLPEVLKWAVSEDEMDAPSGFISHSEGRYHVLAKPLDAYLNLGVARAVVFAPPTTE